MERIERDLIVRSHEEVYLTSEVSLSVKYGLFALNMLFWLLSVFLLIVGMYAKSEKMYSNVEYPLPWFMDPVNLIMIVALAIFVLAFLGWFGALRENMIILKLFEYTINLLLLAEVILAVYVYVDRGRVRDNVENMLKVMIPKYRDDADLQSIIDFIQMNMKCCGVTSDDDWDQNVYFNCSTKYSPERCGVPFSCCVDYEQELNRQCGYGVRNRLNWHKKVIHRRGCVEAIIRFLLSTDNLIFIISVSIVIILLQLITTGLAHSLADGIERQKSKWD